MAVPDLIFAQASPISLGGRSMFAARPDELRGPMLSAFMSHPNVTSAATTRLIDAGFQVLQVTPFSINIAGPPSAFEKTFRTKIVAKEIPQVRGMSTFLDSPDTDLFGLVSTSGTPLAGVIEGVALEVPRIMFDASHVAPPVGYWHLDVPTDIANLCNASPLHTLQITGYGVKVAMVDSGWFRHPYFTAGGYNVAPVVLGPGADAPESDESGHGTGESANIMSIAPQCQLMPVKCNFANTIGAFNAAVALQPDIITCSWGSHTPFVLTAADMALAASVSAAIAAGITVIFSAGNGHAGFPGQYPEVISAGGAFFGPDGSITASDYSSGFQSNIYANRRVPDLCGLVGMRPKAIYIVLPVEPSDSIDTSNGGSIFPDGDETPPDDGWAAFSGTSAAAPQIAGAAALIKQVVPTATPGDIKAALLASARDVVGGTCSSVPDVHGGLPAVEGADDATGTGLLDVTAAVYYAYTMAQMGMTGLSGEVDADNTTEAYATSYYCGFLTMLAAVDPVSAAYLQGMAAAAAIAEATLAAGESGEPT